ncbi:MAG: lysophospholipase [Candidatus Alcyoniella australis]|nr:lysophospholipase [Candidatus Alcyoniella australis]
MTTTEESTGTLTASDGIKLFYRAYAAPEQKAGIVVSHGLGDHSGRYGEIVEHLLPHGYSLWIPDHRGHGRSEGIRGHVDRFYQYIDNLHLSVDMAKHALDEGQKLFLFGHSMGGLIAIRFALLYPETIDGVIVSSPALGLANPVPWYRQMTANVLSKLKPTKVLQTGLDKSTVSHDRTAVEEYVNDPLTHQQVSVRWFTESTMAMENVEMYAAKLHQPFLFLIAGADTQVNPAISREIFSKLGSSDKTMKLYDEMYHRLFCEDEERRTLVLQDLLEWLEQRVV